MLEDAGWFPRHAGQYRFQLIPPELVSSALNMYYVRKQYLQYDVSVQWMVSKTLIEKVDNVSRLTASYLTR